MSVTLRHFGPAFGLPDLSPFCTKLDCYLRMAEIPFESKSGNPQKSPKGKMPFIQHNGQNIADTAHIIDYLKQHFTVTLDDDNTPEQLAQARLLQSTFEEHYYFVMLYFRWQDDAGWHVYKEHIGNVLKSAGVPGLLLGLIMPRLRKGVVKSLHAQGIGRHTRAEVLSLGTELIDAFAVTLGDKPYFLGKTPSTIDATAFGMLSQTLVPPIDSPLKSHASTHTHLKDYVARIQKTYYEK